MTNKRCVRCDEERDAGQFGKHAATRDGLDSWCRPCRAKAQLERYRANPEKYRAARRLRAAKSDYDRLYAQKRREERPEELREAHRRWRATNPDKVDAAYDASNKGSVKRLARDAVNLALKTGKIVAGPCQRCGASSKVQAHHEDYGRPLQITWLCGPCHGKRHREINAERRGERAA